MAKKDRYFFGKGVPKVRRGMLYESVQRAMDASNRFVGGTRVEFVREALWVAQVGEWASVSLDEHAIRACPSSALSKLGLTPETIPDTHSERPQS